MPVLYCKGGTCAELSQQGGALYLHFVVSAWCCSNYRISRLCLGQVPVQCMLVFHCTCMVLYSEKTFSSVFGPSSGAERLNAKKIWDEDHDAILEEIGRREGLDHDEEASLCDASGDRSSSSEEDGSNQE
jgi:hypothetical protein